MLSDSSTVKIWCEARRSLSFDEGERRRLSRTSRQKGEGASHACARTHARARARMHACAHAHGRGQMLMSSTGTNRNAPRRSPRHGAPARTGSHARVKTTSRAVKRGVSLPSTGKACDWAMLTTRLAATSRLLARCHSLELVRSRAFCWRRPSQRRGARGRAKVGRIPDTFLEGFSWRRWPWPSWIAQGSI